MAELPPNQFVFGALDLPPDRTAAPASQPESPVGAAVDLSCIGEIFAGARRLFDPDPAAYTSADQAYYDLLRQIDDPHTPDLIAIPDEASFMIEIGPPPLFLRKAS